MNKPLKLFLIAIVQLALLWGWIALLDVKRGPLPPLGRFLSPFEGFWRNGENMETPAKRGDEVTLAGLSGTVVAEFDRRGVPHLFAPDLTTLFFAQGYVTARDRLWQMDIQSRAGLGRLAEILGPGLLRFDQERRRMGMPASASASLEIMMHDSLSRVALEAYSAGVNAWITSLKRSTYPIEFKLLDYRPEPWSPLKSVVLIKNMQWTLSRGHDDVGLTRVFDSLGPGFFARYYPRRHPGAEPVFPHEPTPDVEAVLKDTIKTSVRSVPSVNEGSGLGVGEGRKGFGGRQQGFEWTGLQDTVNGPPGLAGALASRADPGSGSNNFAISGARTRSGNPILANDPHLDLTLPSLWYETQLKSGGLNAYGVALPGLPGLVIGFTRSTAWGLTNGMNDVFDWHEVRFRNDSLNQYLWRGRWRKTRRVVDTIAVRGRSAVIDTQLWTHAGPVPVHGFPRGADPFGADVPALHAVQWTALHPSNELGAFLRLLTAQSVYSFRRAVSTLETPAQNIVFATRNDIALVHQGRMPVKRAGQGRLLARGTVSPTEWRWYMPLSQLPSSVNPERGWLASANQELTPSDDPHYYGSGFYPPERSQRLHRLLVNEREATLSSAWDILGDDYSRLAAKALPILLGFLSAPDSADGTVGDSSQGSGHPRDPYIPHRPVAMDTGNETPAAAAAAPAELDAQGSSDSLDKIRLQQRRAHRVSDLLRAWDFRYTAAATAPVLFDIWWREFYASVWDDELGGKNSGLPRPSRAVTLALLAADTLADAFDDIRTPGRESAGDLARASFHKVLQNIALQQSFLHKSFGLWGEEEVLEPADSLLSWGQYRPVTIPHLLRLAPLGVSGVVTGGCAECINAQKSSHGPSWRMVVQTGQRPEAWGIYPGGQSGNPGSPRYDAFIKDWAEGRAYRLLFLRWPLEVPDSTVSLLALKAKR